MLILPPELSTVAGLRNRMLQFYFSHESCSNIVTQSCTFLSLTTRRTRSTSLSCVTDFLREDTMIGTSFLRVAAHDDDFGTNAAITYSMSGEQPEYLRVNPLTGWVYVNQPISQVEDIGILLPFQ